jgi:ribosomal protein S12 methylthiotransferase
MNKQINFSAINLWCTKNLVDLEFFLWEILKENSPNSISPKGIEVEQFNFYENPEDLEVEYVIINTCWFLSSSRDEAESTMKYYDKLWKKLIIIGCYTQVKNDDFLNSLDNLFQVLSYKDFEKLKDLSNKQNIFKEKIDEFKLKKFEKSIWQKAFIYDSKKVRAFLKADLGYEYLKIAEWCNNSCSFCIIPEIRWKQNSSIKFI